jgi:hypothetical protein
MMGFYGKLKDTTKAVPSFTTAGLLPMPHRVIAYEILIQLDRKEGANSKSKAASKKKRRCWATHRQSRPTSKQLQRLYR